MMRHFSVFLFLILTFGLGKNCPAVDEIAPEPTIDLSCREASLRGVLGALAIQKGINLVGLDLIPETTTITIHLTGVPLEAGLSALLSPTDFTFEKRAGSLYYIRPNLPEAQREPTLTVTEGRLTLSANATDIKQVVRALATAGISITTAPHVQGTITAHISDKPIEPALTTIFADYHLTHNNGIYRVAQKDPTRPFANSTIRIVGDRISITCLAASLPQLLTELASRTQINLSVIGNIDRPLTARLENKRLPELLKTLATMTGYTYRRIDDLHLFGRSEIIPNETNPLIEQKTVWLTHLPAKEVLNLLPINIPKQNVVVSELHNTVTVVGDKNLLATAEQFLSELDIATDAIRSRSQGSIAITIQPAPPMDESAKAGYYVDINAAPLFDVVRELSIATTTDVVFLSDGETTQTPTDPIGTGDPPPVKSEPPNTVTLRLTNATLDTVITALFLKSNYTYKWHTPPNAKPMLLIGLEHTAPLATTERIPLSHIDVTSLLEQNPHPELVQLTPLPEQSAVLATGAEQDIITFRAHLKTIDVPQPQATIRLYLLELTKGSRDELGLSIDTVENNHTIHLNDGLSLSFDTRKPLPPNTFRATLSALVSEHHGKVLATPSLTVVNGKTAKIDIGSKHLFETNNPIYPTIGGGDGATGIVSGYPSSTYRSLLTIETGIFLELTPQIGAEGDVNMDIDLQIRDANQIRREASDIDQREVQTTIRVKDQGMVVIGGLFSETEKTTVSKVPILHHIPLLGGWLFTNKKTRTETTELIVIIQPTVIRIPK